jgi:hypothetical protein
MDNKEILEKINNSVRSFLKSDSYLLVHDVNERSITHKLAEHLQSEFTDYHVDCEYNKNASDENRKKKINLLLNVNREELINNESGELLPDDAWKSVFPDIIIHVRSTDINLCILEVKKSTNKNTKDGYDDRKLECYTVDLKDSTDSKFLRYQLGLFIEFITANPIVGIKDIKCFENGKRNKDLEKYSSPDLFQFSGSTR